MRLRTRIGVGVVAATALAGVLPAGAASGAAVTAAGRTAAVGTALTAAGTRPDEPTRTVTLITGDRLAVATDGSNRFTVLPTPGREQTRLSTTVVRGHLQVTPVDALPLVHTGRLDSRLFDVTALLNYGYDDRHGDLPLIVTTTATGFKTFSTNAGATVTRDLPAVNGYAVAQDRDKATEYWKSLTGSKVFSTGVDKVWLDAKAQPTLDASVPQIGAPQAWAAGYTGAAVPVGVVDTGIDDTHPDLAAKVAAAQDFTTDGNLLDKVGHGTHVASTIAGSGAASAGKYKGVAPDAKLYSAKVCLADGCEESAIIAGMEWAAGTQHAKVVNLSLGGTDSPDVDPLEQAVQRLTAQYGTLFVVAAGNSGGDGTVGSPSTADDALSVAAVSKTEQLADFSSRGPRGDGAIKPEISAPGVDIVAARGKDGVLGDPTGPGDRYVRMSGTSMATPHVAGSAAILAQQHPDWTPGQLKAALMAAARPNPAIGVYGQGAGRVDIARAVKQAVTSTPTSIGFGRANWPHNDDEPIAKTVTYHNAGTAPVTFTLAMHTTGPDGKPAAAGLFTVSPATVTVPAGGDSAVTVTVDTRVGDTDGTFGGQLTATAAETTVQTPVAVTRDVESYEVMMKVIDRSGNPAPEYDTMFFGLDPLTFTRPFDPSGTLKVRLPKGRYNMSTTVYDWDGRNYQLSVMVQPLVTVDHAQSLTVDARTAKTLAVSMPTPDAKLAWANIAYAMPSSEGLVGTGLATYTFNGVFTGQVGPSTPVPGFVGKVSGQWGRMLPNRQFDDSPFQYQLMWPREGSYFTGFERTVDQRTLATVNRSAAVGATGAWSENAAFPRVKNAGSAGSAIAFRYALPENHVEYYNAESGVDWTTWFVQQVPSTDPAYPYPVQIAEVDSPYTVYQRGRTYTEKWNQGVFGPALPTPEVPERWISRFGDRLTVATPAYGDGAGRAGYSLTTTSSVTVEKDGVQVGAAPMIAGQFTVPAEAGRYRVVQEGNRSAPFTSSTKVRTEWTFRSGHVDGDTAKPLPVSAIGFAPALDLQNRAPANCLFAVPVHIRHQPGSAATPTRSFDLRVSYDDGTTWTRAVTLGLGDDRVALLHHPAGGGYVSLKAKATDFGGNTVEQTIVRAYQF